VSQGSTVDEALANLTEALELSFEDEPAPVPPIVRRPGTLSSILQHAGLSGDDLRELL
jgi:predicted RNase H-like HicB family nuclease